MSERENKAGYVTAVSGSKVTGVLADTADEAESQIGRSVQIGSLVKVLTPRSIAFGVVSSLQILNPSSPPLGRATVGFWRSTSSARRLISPTTTRRTWTAASASSVVSRSIRRLGSPIYETTYNELSQIYARPRASNIQVGALHQDRRLPVYAVTDDLLGQTLSPCSARPVPASPARWR